MRLDAGVTAGSEVSLYYDPMLAKLIVFGSDRDKAVARFEEALDEYSIDGIRSNLPLLLWIARDEAFRDGETTTSFLPQRLDETIVRGQATAARGGAALRGRAAASTERRHGASRRRFRCGSRMPGE